VTDDGTAIEIAPLLAAGGMYRDVLELPGGGQEVRISPYGSRHDPAGADLLGRTLAERLRGRSVQSVVIWEDGDLVLAHVVARELGALVGVGFDDGGLARLAEPLRSEAVTVIIADAFRTDSVPRTLAGLISSAHASLVAACCLVATESLDVLDPGVARVALADEFVLNMAPQGV
jgi:uncharacterized circularly permuted ATP-grasp superfamily protein